MLRLGGHSLSVADDGGSGLEMKLKWAVESAQVKAALPLGMKPC